MNIILVTGPQGSGKGTQSLLLAERTGLPHISVGALLRAEIASGSELGREVKAHVEGGTLVPPELSARVLGARLAQPDAANGVIIDGFPRFIEQAELFDRTLKDIGRKIDYVIYLDITDDEALRRLGGRVVCTNPACERNYHVETLRPKVEGVCDACGSPLARRKDDVPEAIARRLAIYHRETVPVIDKYRAEGLLRELDAMRTIGEVHADIIKVVGVA